MILQIAVEHVLRQTLADVPGGARGNGARIDGEKIAPGRQHVLAAAPRRAGRARSDKAAAQGANQRLHLRRRRRRRVLRRPRLFIDGIGRRAFRRAGRPSGEWPNTCSPSLIRISLRSHSQASSWTSASSSFLAPHSCNRPVLSARCRMRSASIFARRGSRPCACAYSSNSASISTVAPCAPALTRAATDGRR